jgi:hypothetical protein
MSFTSFDDAIAALSSVEATQEGITNFVRQLSVAAEGETTVLRNSQSNPFLGRNRSLEKTVCHL